MKFPAAIVVACVCLCVPARGAPPAPAQEGVAPKHTRQGDGTTRVNVNLFLGVKTLESAWAPVDDEFETGLVTSFGLANWPVEIALDLLSSHDGGCWYFCFGTPPTGDTVEADAGVRKTWKTGKVLPYAGAGLGLVRAKFNVDQGSIYAHSSDTGVGVWAGVGLLIRPRESFEFGLDVRYTTVNVDLDFGYGRQSVDAGGLHYGLLFGFGM